MSENIIKTIGQHVFKYQPPKYTEKGAPFLAKNKQIEEGGKKKMHFQFLGEGFYFWDDNIDRAHEWGKSHYRGNYKILEVPLDLQGERFLDLVGSRKDIDTLLKVMISMKGIVPIDKLGAFIHGMQEVRKKNPKKWPYTIVRALNLKQKASTIPFNDRYNSNFMTNPEVIICFYDKKEINLQEQHIIDKKT